MSIVPSVARGEVAADLAAILRDEANTIELAVQIARRSRARWWELRAGVAPTLQ